jgi:hypothetical protein
MFHCNSEGVNLAVENLNGIFDLSASLSNLKNLKEKKKRKHRDPEHLSLRLHYGESLKQYRNTLRKKMEQHVRNQLNVIEESIESIESNHFWENSKTLNNNTNNYLSNTEMDKPPPIPLAL